jgi:hypothetical protein
VRSHTDAGLVCAVALVALGAAATSARVAAAQPEPVAAKAESPRAVEIARAIDIVKQDPNLAERTIKMLRWKNAGAKPTRRPGWLSWIAGFFDWVGQSARVLVWCAAIVLAAMLVVYILRVIQTHGLPDREDQFVAPTHVRDLDIRPETLPADIGAAARGLWDRGDQRAALALLYRGLLSRLVHVYRLAIRDSSTEGDCLALAAQHLTETRREYASRLIGAWQRSVYGREDVAGDAVYALCDDFARVLGPSTRESIAAPGAA